MNARALSIPGMAAGLAALLCGCVLSVEPVVPESEAMFDPGLLGTWEDEDANRFVVSRAKRDDPRRPTWFPADETENTYSIEHSSAVDPSTLLARLGRLDGQLVLEVSRRAEIRGHLLLVLDVGADEVRARALEPAAFLKALEAGELRLAHLLDGRNLVLRDTSAQLRDQLAPYLGRPGALSEPRVLRRVADPGPADVADAVPEPCLEASPWPEADRLFRRDPRWLGTESASSVDLGGGRILWLFGRTWVDPAGRGERRHARLVGNSVAIQTGADPETADIAYYWGTAADGSPAAFFPDQGDASLRFGQGVRVADRLVLFFARLRNSERIGWGALKVSNPDDEPSTWRIRPLDSPADPLGALLGYTAVLEMDGHVYAFGSQEPVRSVPVFVARWPSRRVRRGELGRPEWWAGAEHGWVADASRAHRRPVFDVGQPEMGIVLDPHSGQIFAVHTVGDGPADIAVRSAPRLVGPWSDAQLTYRPAEYHRPHLLIRGARAHAGLSGADLVLSYTTSATSALDAMLDPSIHRVRFLRLTQCE